MFADHFPADGGTHVTHAEGEEREWKWGGGVGRGGREWGEERGKREGGDGRGERENEREPGNAERGRQGKGANGAKGEG